MPNPTPEKNISDSRRQEVISQYQILDAPRIAIEAANVGTWMIDDATRVFITSSRVKELFGYDSGQELTLEAALMCVTERHREKISKGIEETFKTGKPYHVDFSTSGLPERKLRWVKAVGGLYTDPEGKLTHISGVMMDITEQKQGELRKNKFIGMVSHELKTPLTSLRAYVQMLHAWARKRKDDFTVGALAKMEKQVKKMGNMINGFLSLNQVESGNIHLDLKDFELNNLINNALEETRLLNPSRTIKFSQLEIVELQADPDKIEQVLINLVSNAIKYSPEEGVIEITTSIKGEMAEVRIKDEGIGIAPSDMKKLFERYFRVENKHTEQIPGFGIGLYLCAEIIRIHNGKIWGESEPGKGSEFCFQLPLKVRTN
ncbi:MAG: ATP-binding protein [Bacteroidota bacterium]